MTAEDIRNGLLEISFKAIDRLGVPVTVLLVLLYFGREAAIALHETLVKPVVASHIEFLDATRETLAEIGSVQQKQASALEDLATGQREILGTVQKAVAPRGETAGRK